MEENVNEIIIYLLAGMKAKIKAPVDPSLGRGWFPDKDYPIYLDGQWKPTTMGFAVADESVGVILYTVPGEVAIVYHHKKAMENRIWFRAATGEMAVCTVSSVPIHDHSTVVQGGPAYGTYYNDDDSRGVT